MPKISSKMQEVSNKIQEVDNKLEDIQRLKATFESPSTNHLLPNKLELEPKLLPIEEDRNIQEYESCKQKSEWREKYQDQYVAFADGQQIEDVSLDDSKELETFLDKLRNSEHNGKSIFYKKVPKNNIVDTQESDKFIEEEEFYELPISFYDLYVSEDEN
jgi:hypothetical protein